MEKKIMAAAMAAVVMFALGSCAESSVGENEALVDVGASDSVGVVTANDVVQSMAESMAQSMFESMVEGIEESVTEGTTVSTAAVTTASTSEAATEETTEAETETSKTFSDIFVRKSEDESHTLTIDSEIFPYDCEEIVIKVETEIARYIEVDTYKYIDLGNLKNYPNLKRLTVTDTNAQGRPFIKLINGDSAAGLENLEEITLQRVVWEEDWLSGIGSLKKLSIEYCYDYSGEFLENLKQVETLYLYRCAVSDLSFINGMSSLRELTLDQIKLNNASFDGVEDNYSVKRLRFLENSYYIGDDKYSLT
ncbi:MAG: hypothetical protein K2N72_10725, partial [Oscillospiraceae bacterium]|nr:hypothetical protein [Oscillospiraceae bacterium]